MKRIKESRAPRQSVPDCCDLRLQVRSVTMQQPGMIRHQAADHIRHFDEIVNAVIGLRVVLRHVARQPLQVTSAQALARVGVWLLQIVVPECNRHNAR